MTKFKSTNCAIDGVNSMEIMTTIKIEFIQREKQRTRGTRLIHKRICTRDIAIKNGRTELYR